MTNKDRQQIPVVRDEIPPTALTRNAWLRLYDAAYECTTEVHIHQDERTYHAEASLRLWAKSKARECLENEVTDRETGERYINLELRWRNPIGAGAVIYRIRELVRIDHGYEEQGTGDEIDGVYGDGVEPDSNDTLGLSQEFSR